MPFPIANFSGPVCAMFTGCVVVVEFFLLLLDLSFGGDSATRMVTMLR